MKQPETSRASIVASTFYVLCTLIVLAIPVIAIPWAPEDESAELQTRAAWPGLFDEDGSFNIEFLSEAGDWLDDHFAFRQQMIAANAKVQQTVFGTSAVDQVVVGTDDWLYYAATLPDYERIVDFTEQTYRNMAKNLSLAQEYVEANGAEFLCVVAPDKSNAAGQNMPYYLVEGSGPSVAEQVTNAFSSAGVRTVSLLDRLEGHPEWYFKTDSHWNTQGALQAYYAMNEAAGVTAIDYSDVAVTYNTDFVGDIEAMLYPVGRQTESEAIYEGSDSFTWTEGEDVADSIIGTESTRADANGSLYMYRDSFANSLIPFYATQFKTSVFSKYVPYDLTQAVQSGATLVVVERAERHASLFASDPAIMPALTRDAPSSVTPSTSSAGLSVREDGGYYVVTGSIPGTPQGECSVMLETDGICREAALVSTFDESGTLVDDNGFLLYILKDSVATFDESTLYVSTGSGTVSYNVVVTQG
jgi:hypothetical protein